MDIIRCAWAERCQEEKSYHDHEWGVPLHDERRLFELLILEGMQAGLTWTQIIKKRDNFRVAFDNFDPEIIAAYDENKINALMQDAGIIRNRLKIASTITNARAYLDLKNKRGGLDPFLWDYVGGAQIRNAWKTMSDVPATTELSDKISKDLKKLGFKFVGSTIIYAYMQAAGLVNDHMVSCFRHAEI